MSGDLSLWLVEKRGVKLVAILQVPDRQGSKGCAYLVLEQSQVETRQGSLRKSQGEGLKKLSTSGDE